VLVAVVSAKTAKLPPVTYRQQITSAELAGGKFDLLRRLLKVYFYRRNRADGARLFSQ
jgi:hypothetical protein